MAMENPIPVWQDTQYNPATPTPQSDRDILSQEKSLEGVRPAPMPEDMAAPKPRFPGLQPITDVLNIKPFGEFGQSAEVLADTDWMHNWAAYQLNRNGIGEDPSFRLDHAKVKADIVGLDETWTDELLEANSQEEYDYILGAARVNVAREQEIASWGGAGFAGRLMLNILDPSMIGLSLGGEALLPATLAAKSTRLGRVLKTGTAIGGINAAAEAGYMGLNPTTDWTDVGTAFALGMVFGGVSGALKGSRIGEELAGVSSKVVESNERLPVPYVPGLDGEVIPPARAFKSQGFNIDRSGAEDIDISTTPARTPPEAPMGRPGDTYSTYNPGNLGAAGNPSARAPLTPDYQPIYGDNSKSYLDWWRIDATGAAIRSTMSNWMRHGFGSLLDDGVGAKSTSDLHVSELSASVRTDRLWNQSQSRWYELVQPSFKKWRNDGNSTGMLRGYKDKGIFMRDVSDYVEWDDVKSGARSFHPEVVKVGNRYRTMMKSMLEEAKAKGVEGFENITPDKFYAPKFLDHNHVSDIIRQVLPGNGQGGGGWEGLISVVRNAILHNHPDIDPKLLERFAKGYMERIAFAVNHMDEGLGRQLGDVGSLVHKIHEIIPGIDPDDALALAKTLAGKQQGASGLDARTMSRAGLNYDVKTKVWMQDVDGKLVLREVSVGDFFVKDAEWTMLRYARQMAGRVALADTKIRDANGNIVMDGIKGRGDFEKFKSNVKEDYNANASPSQETDLKQQQADMKRLDFAWDHINGSFDGNSFSTGARGQAWMRRLSWYNFMRLMNNMGFNQVQEFVGIYNQHGLRAMMKGIPSFGRVINAMGESKKRDAIVAELQGWIGLGQDTIYAKSQFRYDHERWGDSRQGRAEARVDRVALMGREATVSLSGMKWINAGLQQWAMKSATVRFNHIAKKGFNSLQRGGKLDAFFRGKDLQRLKSLGLRDEDIHGIIDAFNTKVTRSAKGDVEQLNLDAWDPNVRAKFTDAIFRATNKAIQTNDPGNLAMWMQYDLAKFVLQFKSFIISAYTKQTLYGLRHMDFRQVVSWMMQLAACSLTWYGMRSVASLAFNDEQQEKSDTDGEFGWKNVLLQGFARTPAASIIPTMIDTAWSPLNNDPIFAHSRASGMAMGGIDSLPVSSAAYGIGRTIYGAVDSTINDRAMTQSERMGFVNASPFSNWLPIATLLKNLNNDAPSSRNQ